MTWLHGCDLARSLRVWKSSACLFSPSLSHGLSVYTYIPLLCSNIFLYTFSLRCRQAPGLAYEHRGAYRRWNLDLPYPLSVSLSLSRLVPLSRFPQDLLCAVAVCVCACSMSVCVRPAMPCHVCVRPAMPCMCELAQLVNYSSLLPQPSLQCQLPAQSFAGLCLA